MHVNPLPNYPHNLISQWPSGHWVLTSCSKHSVSRRSVILKCADRDSKSKDTVWKKDTLITFYQPSPAVTCSFMGFFGGVKRVDWSDCGYLPNISRLSIHFVCDNSLIELKFFQNLYSAMNRFDLIGHRSKVMVSDPRSVPFLWTHLEGIS